MHRFTVALLQMTAEGDQQANLEKGEEFCRAAKQMGADLRPFVRVDRARR